MEAVAIDVLQRSHVQTSCRAATPFLSFYSYVQQPSLSGFSSNNTSFTRQFNSNHLQSRPSQPDDPDTSVNDAQTC